MSYINASLTASETVLHTTKLSLWQFLPHLLMALLLIVVGSAARQPLPVLVVIGITIGAWVAVQVWTTEMAVTNKRIIHKTGLISRNTTELMIGKVESVKVNQGITGRIFGFGRVDVSGTGSNSATFKGVADPIAFRAAVSLNMAV